MNINIKLNKNFVTQYNRLQAEYGTEIAKINGFDDDQLSYTDFIDNFIDKDVVADASIDGNSNVSHKDIVTLLNEMPKPHRKLLAFNKIYYEMQKKFGFKAANDWLNAEWTGRLYLHDSDTSTFKSYCYKGDELITIKNSKLDKITVIFLDDLYKIAKEFDPETEERFDISINQTAIFPKNIEILDYNLVGDIEQWIKIERIVKHKNNKPMRVIKYANNYSQTVTEDHPIITKDGECPAKMAEPGFLVYSTSHGWIPIVQNTEYEESCEWVYDVTTTSGHFLDNGILSHNCFAYDLKDLAEKGLYFIGGNFNAEPAQHLTTFVDFVKEFVSYAANRTSGAVGLPNLVPYMYYFWHKDVESDYLGIRTSHNEDKYARQNFQRFIYAVNQSYVRDGSQSAFTNTSVFDHPYFEALFGGAEFPDGSFMIDYEEEIINFQKLYMEVMSEIRQRNMFTFPVEEIPAA